jgi:hypothetical protein
LLPTGHNQVQTKLAPDPEEEYPAKQIHEEISVLNDEPKGQGELLGILELGMELEGIVELGLELVGRLELGLELVGMLEVPEMNIMIT